MGLNTQLVAPVPIICYNIPVMSKKRSVVIVGMGTMGSAVAKRLKRRYWHLVGVESDSSRHNKALLNIKEWHRTLTPELCTQADVVLVAVKPQNFPHLAPQLKGANILSIMAGVPLEEIRKRTGAVNVARAMPNIAAQYGSAAVALTYGESGTADPGFTDTVNALASRLGEPFSLPESAFDAFIGISGSGIAFILQALHGIIMGGVAEGLSYQQGQEIVMQTLTGTYDVLRRSHSGPGALITTVASAGGTTIAGLRELEQHGATAALMGAVSAAARRSRELSDTALNT